MSSEQTVVTATPNECVAELCLESNLDETRRFLQLLDPKGVFTFQTFDDNDERKDKKLIKIKHGTLDQHAAELTRLNKLGAGVYVMVNEGDGKGRAAKNVVRIRANFADLDGVPLEPVLEKYEMLPQIVVESSKGKYHCYWLVHNEALNDFTPIQKALSERFTSDPAVNDLPRVLRVAGFWHQKVKKGVRSTPFRSRILHDNRQSHSPYSPTEIVQGFNLSLNGSTQKQNSNDSQAKNATENHALKSNKIPEHGDPSRGIPGRDSVLASEAGKFWQAGYSQRLVYLACHQFSKDFCEPPCSDAEVEKVVRSITENHKQGVWKYKGEIPLPPTIQSFHDLQQKKLKRPKAIVPNLVEPGLYIVAAKPKIGKSWVCLTITIQLADGFPVFGFYDCEPCDTLYLALEDNEINLRERLDIVCGQHPAPKNAHFALDWPTLDTGGLAQLSQFLDKKPATRFVAIDTWQRVRPPKRGNQNDYERDYADLSGLQKLAGERQIAIFLVHHEKKGDSKERSQDIFDGILGSTAIFGCVDAAWMLKRKRGDENTTLHATGRIYRDDLNLSLKFDKECGKWEFQGSANAVAMSEAKREIYDAMFTCDTPLSYTKIAEMVKKKQHTVAKLLSEMVDAGQIERSAVRGRYMIPPEHRNLEPAPF